MLFRLQQPPDLDPFATLPLRDIHLPDAVHWWPPAAGWWLLAVAGLVFTVSLYRLAVKGIERRRRRLGVKRILAEIDGIAKDYTENADAAKAIASLSILLRRVALTFFPEPGVAGRIGAERLEWMIDQVDGAMDPGDLEVLLECPYRRNPGAGPESAFEACRRWIELSSCHWVWRHDPS